MIADSDMDAFTVACRCGWTMEEVQIYRDYFAEDDPWNAYAQSAPVGIAARDFEYCPRAEAEASTAFREYYTPRDCVHGMGATILKTQTGISVFAAVRGAAQGPFSDSEKALLQALVPHLQRATRLHGQLASMRAQMEILTGHLDRYRHPLLLVDGELRVLYANAAAREAATLRDGLCIDHQRFQLAPADERMIRKMLRGFTDQRDREIRCMDVVRPSGKQSWRLVLMPVAESRALPLGVSQPGAIILIPGIDPGPEPDLLLLQKSFSLTPAEARVASKLIQGRSLDEIAAETSNSIETVRTHVKRILSKTGTTRQGELIALLLRSFPFGPGA